jgi:fibronectin-binding autotransporter adhesin
MTSTRAYQQTLALLLPVTCLLGASANAQSTWVGTTSTSWATATNWVPGVPAEGANISIADATANGDTVVLDASHGIGSFNFGSATPGTRLTAFTVQTNAFALTMAGGVVANGNFAAVGPTLRGNYIVSGNQTWTVAGATGIFSDDRGLVVRGVNDTAAAIPSGTLVLNGNVTKNGTGAVMLLGLDVSGSGNLVVDTGALKLNAGGNQPLIVGGSGNITVNGTSSLFLARNSGTFTVTRPIIMNGTSAMSMGGGSGTTIASNMAWNDGAHTLSVASSYTFSGAWTGTSTVNKTAAGDLTLSGNNAGYTGTLNINGGRVSFASPFAGPVNMAAAAQIGGESTLSGAVALNGGGIYIDPLTPGALSVTGPLNVTGTNTVNLLTMPGLGADITVLTASNLVTGGVANFTATGYRAAAFTQPVAGQIHMTTGNASRTWNGGAAWDVGISSNWLEGDNKYYQADAVTFGDTGVGSIAITGVLTPSAITFNNSSGNDYFFTAAANNLIAGTTGITKSGTGSVTLAGVNTYTGNIQINAGTLKAGHSQAFGTNGKTITVASGATVDANGFLNANRDYNLIVSGTGVGGLGAVVNMGGSQNFGYRSLTLAADTTIGGSGRWDVRPITVGQALVDLAGFTLTKVGANFVGIVDGTLTNPGAINVNEGTLAFTRLTASGAGNININNGATFALENYTSGSFAKPVVVNGSTFRNAGANLTLGAAATVTLNDAAKISVGTGSTLTIPTPLTGPGTLEKLDVGTLTLPADNTFTGLTITAGNVILSGANSYAGNTIINGGTLQIGNGGTTGSINTNPIELNSLTSGIRFNRSDDFTFPNVITGIGLTGNALNPAAVNKDGNNTLTLSTANTYTGTTRVGAGTIAIGSNASVFGDPTALIDLRGGAIRSSDATARTVPNPISYSANTTFGSTGTGKLTFSGGVDLGGGNKGIVINNDETEFSGVIIGGGTTTALTKTGPGKLIFSGENVYNQATVISEGVVQIGSGGTTGSFGFGAVTNNASIVINRLPAPDFTQFSLSNVISGTGTLTHTGPGNTALTAVNTYTGDTIVTDGSLSTDQPYLADTSSVRVSGNGKLELFHAQTDTIGSFFINGSAQPTGLWGRIGAQALYSDPTIHESASLVGDGLLNVTTSGTPYTVWASDKGLTSGNNAPTDNPDSDGLDNLGEFAFDGNPLSGASGGKIVVKVANVGGQPTLTLTLPVRASVGTFGGGTALTGTSAQDSVTYIIEGSDTLGSWTLDIDEVIGADATAIQNGLPTLSGIGWVYRTFRSPGAITGDPVEFLRARVQ